LVPQPFAFLQNRYLLETGLQILQHEPYTPVMRKWRYDAHGYSS
jgi:hypothetical protein